LAFSPAGEFANIDIVPPSNALIASSPKLLDRVRWLLRAKHYSIRTEQAYVDWTRPVHLVSSEATSERHG